MSIATARVTISRRFPRILPDKRLSLRRTVSNFPQIPTQGQSTNKEKPAEKNEKGEKGEKVKKSDQSMAQLDEETRRAMEDIAGDGGEAGLELEDGKPVAMKRGVRENMFRYI